MVNVNVQRSVCFCCAQRGLGSDKPLCRRADGRTQRRQNAVTDGTVLLMKSVSRKDGDVLSAGADIFPQCNKLEKITCNFRRTFTDKCCLNRTAWFVFCKMTRKSQWKLNRISDKTWESSERPTWRNTPIRIEIKVLLQLIQKNYYFTKVHFWTKVFDPSNDRPNGWFKMKKSSLKFVFIWISLRGIIISDPQQLLQVLVHTNHETMGGAIYSQILSESLLSSTRRL